MARGSAHGGAGVDWSGRGVPEGWKGPDWLRERRISTDRLALVAATAEAACADAEGLLSRARAGAMGGDSDLPREAFGPALAGVSG